MTTPQGGSAGNPATPPPARPFLREILFNTLSSYTDRLVDVVVFIVLVPFVLETLGAEQYGLWTLVWAVISLLGLIDLGFSTAVVKYVADARGRNEAERLRGVVCTTFWVFVGQTAILLVLVGGIYLLFNQIFEIPPASQRTAETVFLIVGAGFSFRLPFAMFRGVLVGYQRLWIANFYKIAATLIYFVAVLTLLPRWPDLRFFALLNLGLTLVPAVAVAFHVKATTRGLSIHPRHFERRLLREIWSFSFYFMLISIAVLIATRVDTLVIKSALPLTAIAVYGIAMRITEHASGFCVQIARTLTPVVAELHGAGDEERLRAVWIKGSKLGVAFAAPLLVGCAVLAHPLIVSWTGPEFSGAVPVLQLLLATYMIVAVHSNSYNLLSMRGEEKLVATSMMGAQLLNLVLSLILVHVWGIVGVALATLISAAPIEVGVIQRRLQHRYGLPLLGFYRQTVLPAVLPATVMSGMLWLWQELHPIQSLLEVAAAELAAVVLFWLLFWVLGFSVEERDYIRQKVGAWRRRRAAR